MSSGFIPYRCLAACGMLLLQSQALPHVVDFEDLALPPESTNYGADGGGGFTSRGADFNNSYTDFGGGFFAWSGWSYANLTDNTTQGFANQFGVITGGGHASPNYGMAFGSELGTARISLPQGTDPVSIAVTNGTYPYFSMLNGDAFAKQFGGPTGSDPDFFKLTVEGRDSARSAVGTVEFFLADYRFADDAQDYIIDQWTEVDLTSLAGSSELWFSLSSSDNGTFGMNTPAYFAADNLRLIPEPATVCLLVAGLLGGAVRLRYRLK